MANTIQLRRSATANAVPTTTQLALGELAINTFDGRLYLKKNNGTESIVEIGSFTSGDFTAGGDLISNFSSGDEGGQIKLNKSVTNTTLTTGVTIDVYQNKLRIYETGGTNRGAYIDLSAATAGVGTNLLSGGGGASISVSDTAPASPVNGSLWWNSNIGVLKIYYNDGTSSQWVDASHISASSITGILSISNGGTGAATAAAALTALGAYPATNPSGYTANTGTVTSVGGTGTVSGLTLTGSVTGSGNLTLGGTLSLTSGNVTTALGYTPPQPTGTGASGTWGISITGNAATVSNITRNNSGGVDVNTLTTSGFYRINASEVNRPGDYGQLLTVYGGSDTIGQLYFEYNTGDTISRAGNPSNVGGSGSWSAWKRNLNTTNYTSYAMPSGSSATNSVDVRAPIFYDSNNTAFYFDGASTTNINTLNGNGKQMFTTGDSYLRINETNAFSSGTWFGSTNVMQAAGYHALGSNGGVTNARVYIYGGTYDGTNVIALDGSNGRITASDIRAPIFYDTDNTGFYINPNGDTNLNRTFTYLGGKDTNANWNTGFQNTPAASYNYHGDLNGGTNAPAAGWWTYESRRHSNATNYWGTQVAWGWEDNANRMFQRNVTGGSFGGWVEYLNTSDRTYSGNLYMTGSIRSTASDMRAPIFYDQDNTGYYVNAAGTSYINALNIGPTANGASYLNINGYNAYGGTGFHGFLTIYNTYSSATNPQQFWRLNGAGGFEIVNSPYNAVLFTFTQGGDFTAAGNVTAYSDRKLKDNFEPISNAVQKVMELNGVTFTRVDKEDTTTRYAGLIAQDVEPVLPEAVQKNDTMSYGEVLSVDYNGTIALLVEAIKEQQEHIKRLEEKVNSLGE